MLPGPTILRRCESCGQPFGQPTIRSGNTFGATYWTDGRMDAPMLPDRPELVKCPSCKAMLWIEDQESIGEVYPSQFRDPEFKDLRLFALPSAEDYLRVLADDSPRPRPTSEAAHQWQRYVRVRAWWAFNDPRRTAAVKAPITAAETANLRALVDLLDDRDANDRLMKAEVLRELGQFEDAAEILASVTGEGFRKAAAILSSLVEARDPFVAEMRFD